MRDRPVPAASAFLICLAIIFFNYIVFGIDIFTANVLQKAGYIALFVLIFTIILRDHDKESNTLAYTIDRKDQTINKQKRIIELQKKFIREWENFCITLNNTEHGEEIRSLILKQDDELTAINSEDED